MEEGEQQESLAANDIDTDQLSTADESPMSPEPETASEAEPKISQVSTDDKPLADDTMDDTPAPSAPVPVENGVSTSGDEESAKGDAASTHSDDSQDEDAREKVGVVEEVSGQSKPTSSAVAAPKTGKRKGFACRCGEKTCRRFLFSFRE